MRTLSSDSRYTIWTTISSTSETDQSSSLRSLRSSTPGTMSRKSTKSHTIILTNKPNAKACMEKKVRKSILTCQIVCSIERVYLNTHVHITSIKSQKMSLIVISSLTGNFTAICILIHHYTWICALKNSVTPTADTQKERNVTDSLILLRSSSFSLIPTSMGIVSTVPLTASWTYRLWRHWIGGSNKLLTLTLKKTKQSCRTVTYLPTSIETKRSSTNLPKYRSLTTLRTQTSFSSSDWTRTSATQHSQGRDTIYLECSVN